MKNSLIVFALFLIACNPPTKVKRLIKNETKQPLKVAFPDNRSEEIIISPNSEKEIEWIPILDRKKPCSTPPISIVPLSSDLQLKKSLDLEKNWWRKTHTYKTEFNGTFKVLGKVHSCMFIIRPEDLE